MKTIIAGSRTLGREHVEAAMKLWASPITEVVCGCAVGIDRAGEEWASAQEPLVPVAYFPAWKDQNEWALSRLPPFKSGQTESAIWYGPQWYASGKSAGFQRNTRMAEYAEACICIWDGDSKGTFNMMRLAKKRGLKLLICMPEAEAQSKGRSVLLSDPVRWPPSEVGRKPSLSELDGEVER